MRRWSVLLPIVPCLPSCFQPGPGKLFDVEADSEVADEPLIDRASGTDTMSETEDFDESPASTSGTVVPDPACGNGSIDDGESCDDGINDGSYGSCLPDCSGPSPHCGDSVVNGPEDCDDGVNDGRYGGCNEDCTLAAFCGDGHLDAGEACDEGESNADAMGCNVDCSISGSLLGNFELSFASGCGVHAIRPAFNKHGHGLVSITTMCAHGDSRLLYEFSPSLEVSVAHHDRFVLPQMPAQIAARDEEWLLANWNCNFVVGSDGTLRTELCDQPGRNTGEWGLEVRGDGSYLAHAHDGIAIYPPTSPAPGDQPLVSFPSNGNSNYLASTFGPNGSIVRVGEFYDGSAWSAFIERLNSSGDLIHATSYDAYAWFHSVQRSADGGYLVIGGGNPGTFVRRLNADLGSVWNHTFSSGEADAALDTHGRLVFASREPMDEGWQLEKRTPTGASVLWSHGLDLPAEVHFVLLTVAPDDSIWLAYEWYDGIARFKIVRYAP